MTYIHYDIFCGGVNIVARCVMKQDAVLFWKMVKYAAVAVGGLMTIGIVTLMFLARGTGEDITGIVAPALFVTFAAIVVAIVAAVVQRREQRAVGAKHGTGH